MSRRRENQAKREDERRSAIHEAGHAIVAMIERVPIESVTIYDGGGCTQIGDMKISMPMFKIRPDGSYRETTDREMCRIGALSQNRRMRIFLAGMAAENIILLSVAGLNQHVEHEKSDAARAAELARMNHYYSGRSRYRPADAMLGPQFFRALGVEGDGVVMFLASHMAVVERAVERNIYPVHAVAEALLERRTLSAQEVRKIAGPLAKKPLPAWSRS